MIYFTSDPHFNHANIIKYCKRPFSTVKEMDKALIINWNNTVNPGDTVYVLGDFAFYKTDDDFEYVRAIFNKLNGLKILIEGNHDKRPTLKSLHWQELYRGYYKLKYNKQHIILSHYRFAEWDGCHRGSIHLHGHEHNFQPSKTPYKIFDVGVDACNFVPVSIETILSWANKRKDKSHHDKVEIVYNPL